MSLEKIKERILQEAREEAARIISDADGKVRAAEQETRKAADAHYRSELESGKTALLREEERFVMSCKAETSAEALRLKNQLIDEVFQKAVQEILRLDDKRYLDFIERRIAGNLTQGMDSIVISRRDTKRITKEWLDTVLKKADKGGHLTIVASDGIQGGFILKGPKAEIDCSLAQLLSDKKEELKPDVSRALFD